MNFGIFLKPYWASCDIRNVNNFANSGRVGFESNSGNISRLGQISKFRSNVGIPK